MSSVRLARGLDLSKDAQRGLKDGTVVKAETTRVYLNRRGIIATSTGI